ncbi:hypothetical protein PCIT_a3840 [Pseudoalteromonas citrea]|uniref:Uncharacterized protein n=1 Tax=Pseudoalteromonas citrea TaxID=43655 RepID=A0AAD4AGJ5_9GAMM|nr:hypothetical protein PCIT_a3840 [Pseudoalteromonas citrea]
MSQLYLVLSLSKHFGGKLFHNQITVYSIDWLYMMNLCLHW